MTKRATSRKKKGLLARARQGVDSLVGLTPEYKRSLGMRSNRARRQVYRAGFAAGVARRGNPSDAGVSLVAAERTALFREAAEGDVQAARSFYLAGYLDGYESRNNPKGESKFARCVKEVAAKSGTYDPRAVCAAAGRKKLGQAEMTRRAVAGKRKAAKKNPRNPEGTSIEAFTGFHGEPPTKAVEVTERVHVHTHLWEIGKLVLLRVKLPRDRWQPGLSRTVDIHFDEDAKHPVMLTANEDRNQMFLRGGDQSVDLEAFGVEVLHESEVLGSLTDAWYYTDKKHLGKQGGLAVYKHRLGEEGGEFPEVIYRTRDKHIEIVGGSYTIPDEGVRD